MAAEQTTQMTVRLVPVSLRDRFKAACAIKRITMQERIIQLIEEDVQREESKK